MIELYNGDCLDIMQELIKTNIKIDTFLVDPPYSISACEWDQPLALDLMWQYIKALRKDTSNIIFFSKQPFTTYLNMSNIKEFKYELIWEKQQATNPLCAKKRIMPIHENISIFYKKLGTYNPQMSFGHNNYSASKSNKDSVPGVYGTMSRDHRECTDGSRYPTSILKYNNVRKNILHPTQKPLELIEYLIKTYTNENDLVLDFTMGSGTTGVACKKLNRNFIGIELDKKYFDIAQKRIEES